MDINAEIQAATFWQTMYLPKRSSLLRGFIMGAPDPSRALLKPGATARSALSMADASHPIGDKAWAIPFPTSIVFNTKPWKDGFDP